MVFRNRRSYRRGRSGRRKRGGLRRKTLGFAQSTITRLRYCEAFTIDVGTAGISVKQYRANSCYDPQVATGGHQPMDFDKYLTIYPSGIVLGSKIVVRQVPSGGNPGMLWIEKKDGTSVPVYDNPMTVLEQNPGGVQTNLMYSNINDNIGRGSCRVSTFSAKKWYKANPFGMDGLIFNAGQDCANQVIYNVCFSTLDGRDPAATNFIVQIDYIVAFNNKKREDTAN